MPFRISVGSASCLNRDSEPEPIRSICKEVLNRVESLKSFGYERLKRFSEREDDSKEICGEEISLVTWAVEMNPGELLVVVQAFWPTFSFPNYISFSAIGKLYAEGLIAKSSGEVSNAPQELLSEIR